MNGKRPFGAVNSLRPCLVRQLAHPKPFVARDSNRHLLNELPCEMWKEVLGCARAEDYVQSMRVSGEFYVLMRLSVREPLFACGAKRHLLNKLPRKVLQDVFSYARAEDYLRSMQVSGEYYVLMRSFVREVPLEFRERALHKSVYGAIRSAETWSQARRGCPLARVSLGKEFLVSVDFVHGLWYLLQAFGIDFCRGRCNVALLVPTGLHPFVYSNLDRCCRSWTAV